MRLTEHFCEFKLQVQDDTEHATLLSAVTCGLPTLERFAGVSGSIELVVLSSHYKGEGKDSLAASRGELTRMIPGHDGCAVCLRLAPADATDVQHISKEIKRLEKRIQKNTKQLKGVLGRLSSPKFRASAAVSQSHNHIPSSINATSGCCSEAYLSREHVLLPHCSVVLPIHVLVGRLLFCCQPKAIAKDEARSSQLQEEIDTFEENLFAYRRVLS